jgi:hypothetical protein
MAIGLQEDKWTPAINARLYQAPQQDFNSNSSADPLKNLLTPIYRKPQPEKIFDAQGVGLCKFKQFPPTLHTLNPIRTNGTF